MAYTPINWQTGDTITAEKMNKMDNGWSVDSTQLFSETVTTTDTGEGFARGGLTYNTLIEADPITVSFNGTDYICSLQNLGGEGNVYGGFVDGEIDFTTIPFVIFSSEDDGNALFTQTSGTYTVSVSIEGVEVSSDFTEAVNKSLGTKLIPMRCVSGVTHATEMNKAQQDGRLLYFYASSGKCFFLHDVMSYPMSFYPLTQAVSVDFDQTGTFVVTES